MRGAGLAGLDWAGLGWADRQRLRFATPIAEMVCPITMADFHESIKKVNKSVGSKDLEKFQQWTEEFGSR